MFNSRQILYTMKLYGYQIEHRAISVWNKRTTEVQQDSVKFNF